MTERPGATPLRRRAGAPLRCAYCRGSLGGFRADCATCGVSLHADCAADLGRCPTLGCRGLPAPPIDRPLRPAGEALLRVVGWLLRP